MSVCREAVRVKGLALWYLLTCGVVGVDMVDRQAAAAAEESVRALEAHGLLVSSPRRPSLFKRPVSRTTRAAVEDSAGGV